MEVRGAQPHEVEQAIALLDTVWAWQNNEAMLRRDPGYENHQTRVGVLDGRVVSMAQVARREMWVAGRIVEVGFVGNVATDSEHRGKGYATAVLRDTVAYLQEEGYDLSMLHAAAPALYERLGWHAVPERVVSFELRSPATAPPTSGYVVRQGNWETDLESVAQVYDRYNKGRTGAIVRSLEHWRAARLWLTHEDERRFLVVEREGRIAAYVRGEKDESVIMELGYLPEPPNVIPALFAAIRQTFDEGRFAAHLPEDGVIDSYLAEHATKISRRAQDVPGTEPAMFLPLHGQSLDYLSGFCFYASDHF